MSGRGVHNDTDNSEGGQHERAGGGGRDERQQWDEAGWCERWSQKEAQSGEMPGTYDSSRAETLLSTGMINGPWGMINGPWNGMGRMAAAAVPRGVPDFRRFCRKFKGLKKSCV